MRDLLSLPDPRRQRERMVSQWSDIDDQAVLAAMRLVPRHAFVPEALRASAYGDHPLPIGHGQTISRPYVVACMTQFLQAEPGMSVLEIGTGSGYQTAVLAALGLDVSTVERVRELYFAARDRFQALGIRGVRMKLDDGTLGWPENGPFERIIVTAGGPDVPAPLIDQLADPGIMIIPVGPNRRAQRLVRVVKQNGEVSAQGLGSVAFVDLVGDHGWEG